MIILSLFTSLIDCRVTKLIFYLNTLPFTPLRSRCWAYLQVMSCIIACSTCRDVILWYILEFVRLNQLHHSTTMCVLIALSSCTHWALVKEATIWHCLPSLLQMHPSSLQFFWGFFSWFPLLLMSQSLQKSF